MRNELQNFNDLNDNNIQVQFTIDNSEPDWNGLVGHIIKEMMAEYLPEASDKTLIMCCGSDGFCIDYLKPLALELGHSEENYFVV